MVASGSEVLVSSILASVFATSATEDWGGVETSAAFLASAAALALALALAKSCSLIFASNFALASAEPICSDGAEAEFLEEVLRPGDDGLFAASGLADAATGSAPEF